MHCTVCGNYISDDNARFCDNCGSALPAGNTELYGPDNGSYPAPGVPPMQPNKNNNRILIPVIAVVIVFFVGLAVFLITGPLKDKTDSVQEEGAEASSEQKDDYTHVTPDDSDEEDYHITTDSYLTDDDTNSDAGRSEYLFPSDTERLTYNILDGYSQEQIRLIANEIYARHGYIFTDEYLNSYFSIQTWYRPRISSMEEVSLYFSDLEEANLTTISNYREYKGWTDSNISVNEEKPSDYGSSDYNDSDFLFPTDKKLLTFDILSNFTRAEIDLMANEPYARHGLDFRSEGKYDLFEHFSQFSWYNPRIKSYDDMPKYFTKIEDTNLSIINRYRERMGWKKNSDPKPNSALAGVVYNEDDFIFPTNDELLTFDILSRYTEEEIRLIANEPYARHGMDFSKIGKDDLYEYFSKFSWYTPCVDTTNEVSKYFTKMEDTNLSIINRYREHMGWK